MSRSRQVPLSEEDRTLWESVARTVRPLSDRRSAAASSSTTKEGGNRPARRAPGAAPDPSPAMAHAAAPAPRAGLERRRHRNLARGRIAIDSRVDLHGLTQERAHQRLLAHLSAASTRGERCVLVITGKGGRRFAQRGEVPPEFRRRGDFELGSGVLKRAVPLWLETPPLAALVQVYGTADARHGGEGALYVLLRRQR